MRKTSKCRHLRLAGWFLAFITVTAHAQSSSDAHPYLTNGFRVDAGMFFPDSDFEITVKGSVDLQPLDLIDFDASLQSDISESIGALQFSWRFSDKWSLWGQYLEWNDRSTAVLTEDVVWGDITFGAGTGVGAGLDTTITRVFFGRSFRKDNRHEFGVGFGGHILNISAFIEGNAIINGVPDGFRTEVVNTNGVLPNLGAWYIHSWSQRWAFVSRLDWLGADIDKYDGHIINASLGVNYSFGKHFGIGLNYSFLELDVNVDDTNWQGSLTSTSQGAFAYLSGYW